MSEDLECANCGWTGNSKELEQNDTCPSCKCNGYLYVADSEFDEEE